jgi:hypothetical protein
LKRASFVLHYAFRQRCDQPVSRNIYPGVIATLPRPLFRRFADIALCTANSSLNSFSAFRSYGCSEDRCACGHSITRPHEVADTVRRNVMRLMTIFNLLAKSKRELQAHQCEASAQAIENCTGSPEHTEAIITLENIRIALKRLCGPKP